jgi:hypothetical protein
MISCSSGARAQVDLINMRSSEDPETGHKWIIPFQGKTNLPLLIIVNLLHDELYEDIGNKVKKLKMTIMIHSG